MTQKRASTDVTEGGGPDDVAAKERKEPKDQTLYFYAFSAFFRG